MKRQHKSWLIAVLAVLAAAMVLTGCSLKEVTSLAITNPPATTYEQGPTPSINFTVEAIMDDGTPKTLTYDEYKSVLKLTGFSTEEVGTFTATITYRNVSVTFDYEVIDGEVENVFAGGDGTETNPYIINTADQFKKLNNGLSNLVAINTSYVLYTTSIYQGKYFKLGADLEFTEADIAEGSNGVVEAFMGVLDGAGHKITFTNTSGEGDYSIFGQLSYGATIRNLDVYSAGSGFTNISYDNYFTVTFENVNRYGEIILRGGNNRGAFVTYINPFGSVFTMKNCNNYVNIKGTAMYVSGFIGYPMTSEKASDLMNTAAELLNYEQAKQPTKITLENCVNYGNMSGQRMGAFFANSSPVNGTGIEMTNCANKGTIVGMEEAGYYFATGQNGQKTMSSGEKVSVMSLIEDPDKAANEADSKISVPEMAPEGLAVTIGEDGSVTVQKGENVAYVAVRGYFYADTWGLKDGVLTWQGTQIQIKDEILTFEDGVNTATAKQVAKHKIVNAGDKASTAGSNVGTWAPDFVAQTYYFGYTNGNNTYKIQGNGQEEATAYRTMTVFVLAFDADGELIGGCKA